MIKIWAIVPTEAIYRTPLTIRVRQETFFTRLFNINDARAQGCVHIDLGDARVRKRKTTTEKWGLMGEEGAGGGGGREKEEEEEDDEEEELARVARWKSGTTIDGLKVDVKKSQLRNANALGANAVKANGMNANVNAEERKDKEETTSQYFDWYINIIILFVPFFRLSVR